MSQPAPSATARFTIGPLCWVCPERDFAAWLAQAKPGERLRYAGGPVLPRGEPAVRAATAAKDAGLISTHIARENGACVYIAERLGQVAPASAVWPEPGSAAHRMMDVLRDSAAKTLPCPTNAVLAIALGLKGAERARYIFGQLVEAGLITVENRGPKLRRIVTICSTGKRTKA